MDTIRKAIQENQAQRKLHILKSFMNGDDKPDSGEHESITDAEKELDSDITNDDVATGEVESWKKNKTK
jgi:hypothetical protein